MLRCCRYWRPETLHRDYIEKAGLCVQDSAPAVKLSIAYESRGGLLTSLRSLREVRSGPKRRMCFPIKPPTSFTAKRQHRILGSEWSRADGSGNAILQTSKLLLDISKATLLFSMRKFKSKTITNSLDGVVEEKSSTNN